MKTRRRSRRIKKPSSSTKTASTDDTSLAGSASGVASTRANLSTEITLRAHRQLQASTTGKVTFVRGPRSFTKAVEAARQQLRREQCSSQGEWIRRIRKILQTDEMIRALLPLNEQGEHKQPAESTVRSNLKRPPRN